MKKARFLNSVGKKYIVGYVIVAVFSVILLMVAVICNNYVSGQYDNAIGEMISINNLENSVEVLNGDINMAYLYLSEEGTENYEQYRKSAEQYLKIVKELQEKSFVREVTDAYCTVESFLGESDFLTDALRRYFESDKQTGFEKLENSYNELQELYSYVILRFQKAYSVKLNKLSQLENRLNALQRNILRLQIGMIVCTLICIGLYLTRVIMEVSRSIATMQKGVESIQDNVLSAEPIQIESNDEFEEFAAAFRLLKYGFLILGGYLGIYGVVLGIYLTVSHLSGLLSFGIPYLVPFVEEQSVRQTGNGIFRIPFKARKYRPVYARKEQRIRLRKISDRKGRES